MKAEVLSQMVKSPKYGTIFAGKDIDSHKWDIKQPRGIPNCGTSEKSTVWLLEWLQMEEMFMTTIDAQVFFLIIIHNY